MEKLTLKQKKFCEFYVGSGNASEAARLAGYSAKSAYAIGEQNLRKYEVVEYINSLTKAMSDERIATATERQRFWTAIMRGQLPEVESLQLKASEILAKAQGDFIQKVEVTSELTMLSDDELDERIRSLTAMLGISI
jgi:phage terminase small subunit